MSFRSLYRKFRPSTFEEIVGQSHVIKSLKNSINFERISHAYLFCGSRGTGKTTVARIFSRAVNCEKTCEGNPCNECKTCLAILNEKIFDVYEMDAASNNGVDNIRKINDEILYRTFQTKHKIYIIDEVHMLSSGAFNALLKTLEEPPENVVFILATTECHKIPETIISRCQRFDFKRIKTAEIVANIERIAKFENINITFDAIWMISEISDGSMRDALNYLDVCMVAGCEVTYDYVVEIFGSIDKKFIFKMTQDIKNKDIKNVLKTSYELLDLGKDSSRIFESILSFFENILHYKTIGNANEVIQDGLSTSERCAFFAKEFSFQEISETINILNEYFLLLNSSKNSSLALTAALIRICSKKKSYEILEKNFCELEKEILKIKKNIEIVLNNKNFNDEILDNNKRNECVSNFEKSFLNDMDCEEMNKKNENYEENVFNITENKNFCEGEVLEKNLNETAEHNNSGDLWSRLLEKIRSESKKLFKILYSAKVQMRDNKIIIYLRGLDYIKVNTSKGKKYLRDVISEISSEDFEVIINDTEVDGNKNESLNEILSFKDKLPGVMMIEE
ncbi:MAG: DNA polymerase III subunit gamma/tau [Clostridiales bacterium]|jgi:DNA polymerase-3 subunit gamma/tau|nr:DNA polymerase III subunit gamma/tau [Clostridiales bacterium]